MRLTLRVARDAHIDRPNTERCPEHRAQAGVRGDEAGSVSILTEALRFSFRMRVEEAGRRMTQRFSVCQRCAEPDENLICQRRTGRRIVKSCNHADTEVAATPGIERPRARSEERRV